MATPTPTVNTNQNGGEQGANSIITALGNAFKSPTGEPLPGDRIAQLLFQNMSQLGELVKQGKLSQTQILQVGYFRLSRSIYFFVSSSAS